jgi:hypothetical protein
VTHTLAELESVVQAALECLMASGPHCAAMFHVNLLKLDDPTARVAGYRDGGLTSLDPAALADKVPFRTRTPQLHTSLMECLASYDARGQPLYLLRLRFVREPAGWQLTTTTLQSTEERARFLEERRSVEQRLSAALRVALSHDVVRATLRWNDLPGQTTLPLGMLSLADDSLAPLTLSADSVAAVAALKAFYHQQGFTLDSMTASLERRDGDDVLVCNDYYG